LIERDPAILAVQRLGDADSRLVGVEVTPPGAAGEDVAAAYQRLVAEGVDG
jgi:hypothetical protein